MISNEHPVNKMSRLGVMLVCEIYLDKGSSTLDFHMHTLQMFALPCLIR